MDNDALRIVVNRLTNPPKGLLAIDESPKTCNPRFEKVGIEPTEENRRAYRELLISAPGIEEYISGYIMHDETIRQATKDGRSFPSLMEEKGLEIGIKVDAGLKDFEGHPGEKVAQGLDGLKDRLTEYKAMGATFAKWRSEIHIGANIPSDECMKDNAYSLAKYALDCQDLGIVPIIEPEVMITGDHSIEKCYEVTAKNLDVVFAELSTLGVFLGGVILKTSMVIAGKDAPVQALPEKVAEMTLKCLKEHVPGDIGAIVFLSGGQDEENSTVHLNLMHKMGELPWNLTFSYSRAIQNPVLSYWAKNRDDVAGAQRLLLASARANSMASIGEYDGIR